MLKDIATHILPSSFFLTGQHKHWCSHHVSCAKYNGHGRGECSCAIRQQCTDPACFWL